MKIILIGPQGCGKGTQAEKIANILQVPHISTGDIFRENMKNQTELGKIADNYINHGKLVPDDVTIKMVKDRLLKSDCDKGFILDGFPRNISQAEMLDSFENIDEIILIDIDDDESVKRLSSRRTCSECKKVYNLLSNPPKVFGICDNCGHTLTQRDDDTEIAIKHRLELYHSETKPIIEHYEKLCEVIKVNGMNPIDEVFEEVKVKLKLN